jgi:hypothetical protein
MYYLVDKSSGGLCKNAEAPDSYKYQDKNLVWLESNAVRPKYNSTTKQLAEDAQQLLADKITLFISKINKLMGYQFVMTRRWGEKDGKVLNIGKKTETLTDEQYKSCLLYFEALRDLGNTYDFAKNTLEDIETMKGFPVIPAVLLSEKV